MSEGTKNLMTSLDEKVQPSSAQSFAGVHLQWFADADVDGNDADPGMDFEDVEEEEEEIITLRPGDKPPEEEEEEESEGSEDAGEVEALRAQVAELSRKAAASDSTGELANVIAEAINKQRPSDDPLQQSSRESDDDFSKRIEAQMFKPGQTVKALQEVILKSIGPAWNQTIGATVEQSRKLLEIHPEKREKFKRYRKEIEDRRQSLPYPQRNSPDVYDRLYDEVVASHSEELNQEVIEGEVARQVAEALKDAGLEVGKKGGKPTFTEGGGRPSSAGPKKKKVFVTPQDHREALAKGMDVKDIAAARARRGA